ncbi:MAG: ATP-dependent zinc metalloprotease FtsH [Trueperaceae bacterium]|nr:ATP-dependent zinc metalloprotease FtsH [Trueperaceae bacterium]MCO5174658.1 ATP-dependent zinc metalloprotease FtsH [Trueperaceae bacterium]MCW5819399.1 ATP-dependent zinc metalloprotease FtsH [Trueperaceae bacterium]
MRRSFNPWLVVMLLILGIFVFNQLNSGSGSREINYSTFTGLVDQGKVASVVIDRNSGVISGELVSESQVLVNGEPQTIRSFRTTTILTDSLLTELREDVKSVTIRNPPQWLGLLLGSFLPVVLLLVFFWFIFMRAQGGPNQVMQFGQSRAKTFGRENKVTTTFNDVAGHKEAKQELIEVVDFLKTPQKYLRIGAEIPKGVLLVGPPGTGKTLLARAVAGEAGVPFLTVSASEFMEMFVGVGASRVRSLFEEARKSAPSIIFIDELDSIGRRRGAGIGGGHDEREQTLNQILSEMDGFEKDTSVIIIAATNRPDILDPALLRPGRFDRQVTIGLPTMTEREEILKVHVRNKPVTDDVSLRRLAEATPAFSGADLENLTNEAALIAARNNKQIITWTDFNEALDRITLGLRRGSLVPTEEERRMLAFHESGHAVAHAAHPELGDIRKVTIMPRGGAGGFMAPLAKEEMFYNVERFKAQLVVAFAGRQAEKRVTGTISSGASNDLKQATEMAKQMVLDLGMGSQEYVAWGSDQGPIFLGGEISRRKDFSEETARQLEEEVSSILESAYRESEAVIATNWVAVEAVATALLKRETLDGKLIHRAFALAQEGKTVAEIADWIVDTATENDRRAQAAEERERRAAEEEHRRKAVESGRAPLEPRPEARPASESGA